MSWNNRVVIEEHKYPDNTVEYFASIREVYYGDKVGSTGDIKPCGAAFSEDEAVLELKLNLELMLEAVNFVIDKKTTVFKENDPSTHNPGERSNVALGNSVLDKDDAYLDEKYGED